MSIQVNVFENRMALSEWSADYFTQLAMESVEKQGCFNVALTGGSSPIHMYELLGTRHLDQIPWGNCYFFWGDERWVPLTDSRSNAGMAFKSFLNRAPVPPHHIFPMWKEQTDPTTFAATYTDELKAHFKEEYIRFDLVLLGMGGDGHTASLFPGTTVLQEKEAKTVGYFLESQQMYRITLTAPLINQANSVVFMVFGSEKTTALKEVLFGERNPVKYPSQLIEPVEGNTLWLVDKEAFPDSISPTITPPEIKINYVQNVR